MEPTGHLLSTLSAKKLGVDRHEALAADGRNLPPDRSFRHRRQALDLEVVTRFTVAA